MAPLAINKKPSCFYEIGQGDFGIDIVGFRDEEEPKIINELVRYVMDTAR